MMMMIEGGGVVAISDILSRRGNSYTSGRLTALQPSDHHGLPRQIPGYTRGEFRPRQTRQLPRALDLKGRLLSCQSY